MDGVSGFAVAVAVSPVPIIAILLLLTSRRGRLNGLLFEFGWVAGLAVLGLVALKLLAPTPATAGRLTTWRGWAQIALGLLVMLVGLLQFRRRPAPGTEVQAPGWMRTLDRTTPSGALGLGALLAVGNPKNGPLTVAAAAAIASTSASGEAQVVTLLAFVGVASLGIAVPLTLFLVGGVHATVRLVRWREWLTQHSAVVVILLAVVLGPALVLDGIRVLA
jgi:threonine/homoserine/homoserine lactone efflux protein